MNEALAAAAHLEHLARQGLAGMSVRYMIEGEPRNLAPARRQVGPKHFTRKQVAVDILILLKKGPATAKDMREQIGCAHVTLFHSLENLRMAKSIKVVGQVKTLGRAADVFGVV